MEGVFIQSVSGYTALVNSSGALNVNASVTANISGQAVVLGSGSFIPLSGLFVQISGQGVNATFTATGLQVSGAVQVSGGVQISGQPGLVFESGIGGISGALPNVILGFDLSGARWNPISVSTSGSNILNVTTITGVTVSGGVSVSGNIGAIVSGGVTISGGVSVSGNVGAVVSGGVTVSGGLAISGGVTVSGQPGLSFESGIGGVSGALPVVMMAFDLSGAKWNPLAVVNSGSNVLNVVGSPNISGGVSVSGGVTVSGGLAISGNIGAVVSGGVNVSGGLAISGGVQISGQPGLSFISGIGGISGALPVTILAWDLSGAKWSPVTVATSGSLILHVTNSGDSYIVTGGVAVSGGVSVSGNVGAFVSGGVSVSGGVTISGGVSVSGNVGAVVSGGVTVSGGLAISGGVQISGQPGLSFESGIGGISGALPVVILGWDLSGARWNPLSVQTSGSNVLNVIASTSISGENVVVSSGAISIVSGEIHVVSGSVGANVSGGVVISGGVTISGGVSISGVVAATISGGVTVSGSVQVSGTVSTSVSGNIVSLPGGAPLVSGYGLSGAWGVANMVYDLSGQVWNTTATTISGGHFISVGIGGPSLSPTIANVTSNADGAGAGGNVLNVAAFTLGLDSVTNTYGRVRASSSGDDFRLRVSTEGQAPTYTVNAYNTAPISGGGAAAVGPLITLFNYGSGTAIQSGSAYKIKGLYITPDPANTIISGQPIKFDIIRYISFSGGGTLTSGNEFDTRDPAYSGTLFAPSLQTRALSGYVLDGYFFSYIMTTAGPWVNQGTTLYNMNSPSDPYTPQNTNLIAARMPDTKEIIIRSGYGFGVVQSSGNNYTQVFSGTYNFSLIYSVEGMTYTA